MIGIGAVSMVDTTDMPVSPGDVKFDISGSGYKVSIGDRYTAVHKLPGEMLFNHSAPIDFAALPRLDSQTVTISSAVENVSGYQMHTFVTHFDGAFWAKWSRGFVTEDQPGQRVYYSKSLDGLTWSSPLPVTPEPPTGWRYSSMGFWLRDGEFYANACLDAHQQVPSLRAFRWDGTQFDPDFTEIHSGVITPYPFQRLPSGEWACFCADVVRDDFFMIGDIGNWTLRPVTAPPGVVFSEPHFYLLPDGRMSTIFRDNNNSMRLYRGLSGDRWQSWSIQRTNFPDATSKSASLRLQDGRYLLASNPNINGGANENTHGSRNPLTLAVSDDGDVFDRMYIVRDEPTEPQFPSFAKNPGYQYASMLEHDGILNIIYSRNKEDIQISRIDVADID